MTDTPDPMTKALAALDEAAAALATARPALASALEGDVQRPQNTPFKPPATTPEEHRREHRSGAATGGATGRTIRPRSSGAPATGVRTRPWTMRTRRSTSRFARTGRSRPRAGSGNRSPGRTGTGAATGGRRGRARRSPRGRTATRAPSSPPPRRQDPARQGRGSRPRDDPRTPRPVPPKDRHGPRDPTDRPRPDRRRPRPGDAGIDAIRAALDGMTAENRAAPDPARSMPAAAVAERMRAHRDRSARMSGHKAEARVDAATVAGHITPAMRDWGRSAVGRPTASTSSSHPRPRRSRSCPRRSTGRARAHPARRISTPAPPRSSRSCPSRSIRANGSRRA